jgi:hypothetical protein
MDLMVDAKAQRVRAGDVGYPMSIIGEFLKPPVAHVVTSSPKHSSASDENVVTTAVRQVLSGGELPELESLGDISTILSSRAVMNESDGLQKSLSGIDIAVCKPTPHNPASD